MDVELKIFILEQIKGLKLKIQGSKKINKESHIWFSPCDVCKEGIVETQIKSVSR